MLMLPSAAQPLLSSFSMAFTEPTFNRWLRLCVGAIVAIGPRTVTNIIWSARSIMPGHFSSYHRVFSRTRWSLWPLGRVLCQAVAAWVDEHEPIVVAIDDTTAEHRGLKVYGRGCHRDATRSSHRITSFRWGHRWVIAAINVKFTWAARPWALPVACALYRPREVAAKEGRSFKTPAQLARQLMIVLMRWLPDRRIIVVVDGGFAKHDIALLAHRHRDRLTFICRFYHHASLYEPAPPQTQQRRGYKRGRPAIKGAKLPQPRHVVAQARGRHATVCWYGGKQRRVKLISRTGMWYRSGSGVAALRWVHVHDAQGTHRDEYLACTDPTLAPSQIVSLYTQRWSIEVTFQEVRHHLGFHTTRQRKAESVLRAGPCLLGLFSVVALIFAEHQQHHGSAVLASRPWYVKTQPTFADALFTVRQLFWQHTIICNPTASSKVHKKTASLTNSLLSQLCQAG